MHDLQLDIAMVINTILAGFVSALVILAPSFVAWMLLQAKLMAIKMQSEVNAKSLGEVKTDLKANTEITVQTKIDQSQIKADLSKVEVATNSMQDQLIKATALASLARGKEIGKAEEKSEAAQIAKNISSYGG